MFCPLPLAFTVLISNSSRAPLLGPKKTEVGRCWLAARYFQAALSLPLLSRTGGESRIKKSWVEIKAG